MYEKQHYGSNFAYIQGVLPSNLIHIDDFRNRLTISSKGNKIKTVR